MVNPNTKANTTDHLKAAAVIISTAVHHRTSMAVNKAAVLLISMAAGSRGEVGIISMAAEVVIISLAVIWVVIIITLYMALCRYVYLGILIIGKIIEKLRIHQNIGQFHF